MRHMVVLPHWASSGYSLQAAAEESGEIWGGAELAEASSREEGYNLQAVAQTSREREGVQLAGRCRGTGGVRRETSMPTQMQYQAIGFPSTKTVGVTICYLPWPAAGSAARP